MTTSRFLRGLSLRGWRSYDSVAGVTLDALGPVNVLIGPNNVGKSNLARFLIWLRIALRKAASEVTDPWDSPPQHAPVNIKVEIAEADYYAYIPATIECDMEISAPQVRKPLGGFADLFLDPDNNSLRLRIRVTPEKRDALLLLMPVSRGGEDLFDSEGQILVRSGQYAALNPQLHVHKGLPRAIARLYADSVFDIQALRDYTRQRNNVSDTSSFDGGLLVSELMTAKSGSLLAWQRIQTDLETWLARLLGETRVPRLEVASDGIRVTFLTGLGLQMKLESLGSGVAEMMMLLAFLRLKAVDGCLVLLDEPEAHLHPAAAAELVRIAGDEFPLQQVILTTHSTAVIDAVSDKWKVFKASRNDAGSTRIALIETHHDRLQLLRDLGMRASQLFLATTTLWVEGPSDVVYLRRLIDDLNSSLLEGRDFAFAMYGGSLMSHLTFDVDDSSRIVRLLLLSSNPVVIADRDAPEDAPIREAIQTLERSVTTNANTRVFITPSLEIENCIHPEELYHGIRAVMPRWTRGVVGSIPLSLPETWTPRADAPFDVAAAQAVVGGGCELSDEQRKLFQRSLAERKLRLAEEICTRQHPVFTTQAVAWGRSLVDVLLGEVG